MALTTGFIVCALLATEIAGALYLARYVRARRKRHQTGLSTGRFPHLTPRNFS